MVQCRGPKINIIMMHGSINKKRYHKTLKNQGDASILAMTVGIVTVGIVIVLALWSTAANIKIICIKRSMG